MTDLKAHPAADLFPMMDDGRYADLVKDIAAHGQREPITICEGMILDGRNRHRACVELGLEYHTRNYDGDPYAYAWSLNGERRDLVLEQRYLIWAECNEHSVKWQATQKRISDEGNQKRSEAAKAQPRGDGGTFAPVSIQTVYPPDKKKQGARKGQSAKAAASHTNTGAVARGDKLRKSRPDLAEQVRKGTMKPAHAHRQMKRDEIRKVVTLPDAKFRVIYADPPWSYNDKADEGAVQSGGAEMHYPSMSISQLCALEVSEKCEPNAVLFLWVTSPLLFESAAVIKSWGFTYRASFVWDKVKHNMGHYNSVRHEFLLICTRGSCTPDTVELFDSVQSIERTTHSTKPERFREIIDTLYPHGKRLELFARKTTEGWTSYGNQAEATA